MAFFDSIQPPERPEPAPRQLEWIEPSAAEMPASLGIDITLAVGEKAAIYVSRPAAYRNGLAFDLVIASAVNPATASGETTQTVTATIHMNRDDSIRINATSCGVADTLESVTVKVTHLFDEPSAVG